MVGQPDSYFELFTIPTTFWGSPFPQTGESPREIDRPRFPLKVSARHGFLYLARQSDVHEIGASKVTQENEDQNLAANGKQAKEETKDEVMKEGVLGESEEALQAGITETEDESDFPKHREFLPSARVANKKILGQVTLHYPERDVKVFVDGDCAIRLLVMFRERKHQDWVDFLGPYTSSAENGWLVLDLAQPLAMSYLPLGARDPRTAIDPAVGLGNLPQTA